LLWLCSILWSWVLWMLPALYFLLRISLAIQGLFCFHMYFKIDFSISVKNVNGNDRYWFENVDWFC
jgi:hypothetical protein